HCDPRLHTRCLSSRTDRSPSGAYRPQMSAHRLHHIFEDELMLERLHAHREWANQRIIEWILALPQPDEYCNKMISHILLAEANLLRRIHGEPPRDIWQILAPGELNDLREANNAGWREVLQTDLSRIIRYTLANGMEMELVAADMATHVCTHGVYHRGQIAA